MKVESDSEVVQLCPTLSDPIDCSPPGSSVHVIFQARVLEWGGHCLLCVHAQLGQILDKRYEENNPTAISEQPGAKAGG